MTPEERAKAVADEWSANNYQENGKLLEDFVASAIRAAVSEERARYAELVMAADDLQANPRGDWAHDAYRAARAALKGE